MYIHYSGIYTVYITNSRIIHRSLMSRIIYIYIYIYRVQLYKLVNQLLYTTIILFSHI